MNCCYCGKALYINLTRGTTEIQTLDEGIKKKYLGGNGFGVNIIYKEVPRKADPLGEENVLVFATGPATGTLVPSTSRFVAVTKSPLTGLYMDSNCGGSWGTELKRAGYDLIVLKGRSPRPVYIVIEDDQVTIKDATHLWGEKTFDVQHSVKSELNDFEYNVACIGPAGENGVKYACIVVGTRVLGRGGTGAVMGSKNLKAVAVKGSRGINIGNGKKQKEFLYKFLNTMRELPIMYEVLPTIGTTGGIAAYNKMGILGTRNWQQEIYAGAEKLSGPEMIKKGMLVGSKSCQSCPMRCGKVWKAQEGPYAGYVSEGPDFETLYSFGSAIENDCPEAIIKADYLCDQYGMDTISTGLTIAWAMESYEKGLLNKKETGGFELNFGNIDAALALIPLIAHRSGFGSLLAEGVREASRRLGRGSECWAMHTKGLEFAGHSARGLKGMGLGFVTSNRGATHQDSRPTPDRLGFLDRKSIEGQGANAKIVQDYTSVGDSIIICRFTESLIAPTISLGEWAVEIVNLVTNQEIGLEELNTIGERIYNLERMFNVREGITREHDVLPPRIMKEPIPEGPSAGMYISYEELQIMLDEYYQARGWDIKTGIPKPETLKRLGLDSLLEEAWYKSCSKKLS
jgi:aldehyde:ferredoxin oxidoreductase